MMMVMVMVTMMVNVCDYDCYLVVKVILVKEVMSCDVSSVAMFLSCIRIMSCSQARTLIANSESQREPERVLLSKEIK